MAEPSAALGHRDDIDGLRAVAVLAVLAYHAWPGAVPGGFAGVDVFFVLSGFLITRIVLADLAGGSFSVGRFYQRRVRRIFPPLVVLIALLLLFGVWVLNADELAGLARHAWAGGAFVSNLVLWKEVGYFNPVAESRPLLHLWSLGIEEQFYIAWPLLLALSWRRPRGLAWALGLGTAASFGLGVWASGRYPYAAFYLPLTRAWELMGGAVLAYGAWSLSKRAQAWTAVAGAGALFAGFAGLRAGQPYPGWGALLPVLGTVALLLSPASPINRGPLSSRAAVAVGRISYALYLFHWPALYLLRRFGPEALTPAHKAAALGASALLAWASLRWLEDPIRRGGRGALKAWSLAAAMALLCGAALWIQRAEGLPGRAANAGLPRSWPHREWYRGGTCFLDPGQGPESFAADCAAASGKGPLALLWGDSHAAAFYPGLQGLARQQGWRLAQYTVAQCPPLAEHGDPGCRRSDAFVLDQVRRLRPRVVFVAGYWLRESGDPGFEAALRSSVEALKAAGAAQVVVLGQLPVYDRPVPAIAAQIRATGSPRTWRGLDRSVFAMDARAASATAQAQAAFASPLQALCAPDGCQVLLRTEPLEPVAWDDAHLSAAGSVHAVERLNLARWLPR